MRFLICFVMLVFISCKQGKAQSVSQQVAVKHVIIKPDSTFAQKESLRIKKRRLMDLAIQKDSIQVDSLAQIAALITMEQIDKETFEKKYEIFLDTTALPVKVKIRTGRFFEPKSKHILIEIKGNNDAYLYVFKPVNKKAKQILHHKEWLMTFMNDTIFDVNGDDVKDYCVQWYGSTGCCLKGFYNVYLYKSKENDFTRDFEFINPTFYPKEKTIRSIAYGQPGETEIYKYQWKNGFSIDTVESIYYNQDKKSKMKFVVEKYSKSKDGGPKTYFKKLPKEYESVQELDWFLGNY